MPTLKRRERLSGLVETILHRYLNKVATDLTKRPCRHMLRIIFPRPYQIEVTRLRQTEFSRLRRQLEQVHLAWATEWKRRQADFRIENIRFRHDPFWNRRILSLQAARDGEVWFWRATRVFLGWGVASI
jgi:hypothetical protein